MGNEGPMRVHDGWRDGETQVLDHVWSGHLLALLALLAMKTA